MHTYMYATLDADIIVDQIMDANAELRDRISFKTPLERHQLWTEVRRLQKCLQDAYRQQHQVSK